MIGTNDVRVGHCINCASLPDRTREMVHAGTLYRSNDFISVMIEIARIDTAACEELAKEIVKKQPGLKAAKKSAGRSAGLPSRPGYQKEREEGQKKIRSRS